MPELPEVETVRNGLSPSMEGALIEQLDQNRADLRFPFGKHFKSTLQGRTILEIKRRAKYLLFMLEDDFILVSHLGMSGSFRLMDNTEQNDQPGKFHHPKSKIEKHDHVVFHLNKNGHRLRIIYNDPRRFGFMLLLTRDEFDTHPFFKDLGPEPTGNGVAAEHLADRFYQKQTPLKSALLDQRNIAGLGNIYVCEALWRAKLSPKRKAGTLVTRQGQPTDRLRALSRHITHVISDAIAAGGSSLNDHIQTDGSLGYFQHSFKAYGQEGMHCQHENCQGTIKRIVQSGRSSFYCTRCQR